MAELGSVFLCRHLHIASAPRADHARYLASWLKCLKAHPRALFKAAALAQQAVDYLEDKAAIVDQPWRHKDKGGGPCGVNHKEESHMSLPEQIRQSREMDLRQKVRDAERELAGLSCFDPNYLAH